MPTNDERREVAARLREPETEICSVLETVLDIAWCIGFDGSERFNNKSIKDRLADLIEPQEHICLGCIKWSAIEGNPVKGVCAEFSDPEDGIERATPYYGYCHEWEGA